jgi:hypothetical protein
MGKDPLVPVLMAMVSILIKKSVMRTACMPKRLTKITQLKDYHYDFLNNQSGVESVHQIILEPMYIDKCVMEDYVRDIFYRNDMLTVLLYHYINIPMYSTNSHNYIHCDHAPPLGDIQSSLNHIVIQYLFDKPFSDKYPKFLHGVGTRFSLSTICLLRMK